MRKNGKCDFDKFEFYYKDMCLKENNVKKKLSITDAMFATMRLAVMPHKQCKDCKKMIKKNKQCCEHYSKFNTITKYFIHGLQYVDEANETNIIDDSDSDRLD